MKADSSRALAVLSLVVIVCGSASPAMAQDVVINGNHENRLVKCSGSEVVINGNHANVKTTGECKAVRVHGNHNNVAIEAAGVIQVLGNHNMVAWERGIGGRDAVVTNLGNKNAVKRAAVSAPPAPPPATLDAPPPAKAGPAMAINTNGNNRTFECQHSDVAINGNDNSITLKGECRNIAVNGNENKVSIEAAERIAVMGNENAVKWQRGVAGPKPLVTVLGTDNKVTGP